MASPTLASGLGGVVGDDLAEERQHLREGKIAADECADMIVVDGLVGKAAAVALEPPHRVELLMRARR